MHLNGQAFGDLSWYQGGARLLLVLTKCNRPTHLPYPIYDIGVDDASVTSETPPLRLVKIHHSRDNVSATNICTPLRTILLVRHRPGEIPGEPMMIRIPLNHAFPPFIRLPEHLFRLLLDRPTVTEVSITNAQLPWSGDPPFMTAFRVQTQSDVLYATVQFGICNSRSTNGTETGSLWATFGGSQRGWGRTDCSHQCAADHVLDWPGLKRRFVVTYHADDKPMGDRICKWMLHMEFTLSEHTGALVLTYITLRFRALLREFAYYDPIEEEEERMKQLEAPAVDPQFPEQSPSPGKELNDSSSALTTTPEQGASVQEDPQSVIEACTYRRLCPGFPTQRRACMCFTEPVAHWVLPFHSSISAFIQLALVPKLHLNDPFRYWYSLAFMSPASVYSSGLGTEDLSLLLP